MKKTVWGRATGAAAILAFALLVSCGRDSAGGREFRLSLILGVNSDWYRGALRFKELVESRTGGRYRIGIYPHSQLAGGVQRTELEMVETGVIDISLESSILLSIVEKRMSVLSLPWLFTDYRSAHAALESPLGGELLGLLDRKGIVGLAYGANGFRQITNSRKPIRSPEDLRDMKIRVPSIKLYVEIFKLLGADPSSMNFGELFTALAQGTMDGQENPVAVIHSSRLYEVQNYLTIWNYSYDPIILCMNRKTWESLPPGIREVFAQCAREAMEYEFSLVAGGERAAVDSLRAKGMEVNTLSPDAVARFRALAEPIYRMYAREIGGDLVDRFRAF